MLPESGEPKVYRLSSSKKEELGIAKPGWWVWRGRAWKWHLQFPQGLGDAPGQSLPLVSPCLQAWRVGRIYESHDNVLCILLLLVKY